MSENWKLIPKTYQPDTADSRKESGLQYVKMYHEDYVNKLGRLLRDVTESLHSALNDSKNRGTQRAGIALLQKAYKQIEELEKK